MDWCRIDFFLNIFKDITLQYILITLLDKFNNVLYLNN